MNTTYELKRNTITKMTSQHQKPAVGDGGKSGESANTSGHSGNKTISLSLKPAQRHLKKYICGWLRLKQTQEKERMKFLS